MRNVCIVWCGILFGFAGHISAADYIEIHLRSGDVVSGELLSTSDTAMEIKTTITGKSGSKMSATITYNRGDIESFQRIEDPEEAYQSRALAAKTADAIADLAVWCREHAMPNHALEQAQRAIGLDAGQQTATHLLNDLGWVVIDGHCQSETSWLAAQGKVRYHGTIMTVADADTLKAQEQQQRVQADAQAALNGLATRIGIEERQLADLTKSLATVTARIDANTKALQAAQALAQKVATTKAAFDAAENDLTNAQVASRGQPAGSSSSALVDARIADDKAQHAYLDAKESAGAIDQIIAQLQAQIKAETTEHDHIDKQHAELSIAYQNDRAQLAREIPVDSKGTNSLAPATDPAAKPSAP